MNGVGWTGNETQCLQELYSTVNITVLSEYLPGRSECSIRKKAQKLRLFAKDYSPPTNMTVEFQKIFVGLMLGDGSLNFSHEKHGNARFRYGSKHRTVSISYKNLFEKHGFSFGDNDPLYRRDKSNGGIMWDLTSHVNEFFTKQFSLWYGEKKVVPLDLSLSPLSVKHWYYGDGSLHWNGQYLENIRLSTDSFTFDEVEFLREVLLRDVGVERCRIEKKDGAPTLIILKSQNDIFFSYMGECDFPCFRYKWITRNRAHYTESKNVCSCII